MTTKIPWTVNPDGTPGDVWNPSVGCSKGCPYCYARVLHDRRHKAGMKGYETPFSEPRFMPDRLSKPPYRRIPTGYFVDSMGDLFDPAISFTQIAQVFEVMAACWNRHRFYLLTKQPERMLEWFKIYTPEAEKVCATWPLPNLYLGVSVTNQDEADERIPFLLRCPAQVRFVSVEPMRGSVVLPRHDQSMGRSYSPLDWVICGPCTGPNSEPFQFEWAESLYQQCVNAGVPFFWKPNDGRFLASFRR